MRTKLAVLIGGAALALAPLGVATADDGGRPLFDDPDGGRGSTAPRRSQRFRSSRPHLQPGTERGLLRYQLGRRRRHRLRRPHSHRPSRHGRPDRRSAVRRLLRRHRRSQRLCRGSRRRSDQGHPPEPVRVLREHPQPAWLRRWGGPRPARRLALRQGELAAGLHGRVAILLPVLVMAHSAACPNVSRSCSRSKARWRSSRAAAAALAR